MSRRRERSRQQPRSSNTRLIIDVLDDKVVKVVSERPVQYSPEQSGPVIQRLISTPLAPTLYDGTFRQDHGLDDDDDVSEGSELSFSEDSATSVESGSASSVDELTLEQTGAKPMFSVARMESGEEERKQTISVVSKVRKHAVGAIVDPDSTVLMQLGRKDSFGHQQALEYIRNINEMLEKEDSVVVLRYPNVEEEQSSRVGREDHVATTRRMMELTEDVLGRVEGNSRESILMRLQQTLEEILNQDDETIVVHSFSRANMTKDPAQSEALVGFFQKDDDAALFVHVPDTINRLSSSCSGSEADQQMSLDQLKNFLQESLVSQEETMGVTMSTEPDITVSKSGDRVVAVMSFPNMSSALLTVPADSIPLESDRSEIIASVKDRFREVIEQPSEKLLVQLHLDEGRSTKVEQMKYGLDQILKTSELPHDPSQFSVRTSEDKVIGKLSYSGGSIVIQTSSKNWAKPRCNKPEDLVQSIRGVIEQFMINNELSDQDLKNIANILVQVFYIEDVDLPQDFLEMSVLGKIESVVQQLMNRTIDEYPLMILGQIQVTLQEISQTPSPETDDDSWDLLKTYFEGLICGDNDYYGNTILPVLRRGLLVILSQYERSLSGALEELVYLLKQVPNEKLDLYPSITTCPGAAALTEPQQTPLHLDSSSLEVVQKIHNLLTTSEPTTVSYLSTFHALFFAFLSIISSWTVRVKSFLGKDPPTPSAPPLDSQPSMVSKKPSVSFHLVQDDEAATPPDFPQQLEREQKNLNETIDSLRAYLERTLETPKSWQQSGQGSLVDQPQPGKPTSSGPNRMMQLFTQLLEQSEQSRKLPGSQQDTNTIHLRLESTSAVLERKEDDQAVMLSGSIRDRDQNVGLFFEARLVDLLGVPAKKESELECVVGVRRMSDEVAEEEAAAVAADVLEGCLAEVLQERKADVDWGRYFEQIQSHIEESIDPLRDALGQILEKLGTSGKQEGSYFVELAETVPSEENAVVEEVICTSKSVQFEEVSNSASSIPGVRSTSDRLMSIEGELRELKQLMQFLLSTRHEQTSELSMDSTVAEQIIMSTLDDIVVRHYPSQESDLETLYESTLECTEEQLAELQRLELEKISNKIEAELGEVLETTRSIGTMVEQMSRTRLEVEKIDVAVQVDGKSLEDVRIVVEELDEEALEEELKVEEEPKEPAPEMEEELKVEKDMIEQESIVEVGKDVEVAASPEVLEEEAIPEVVQDDLEEKTEEFLAEDVRSVETPEPHGEEQEDAIETPAVPEVESSEAHEQQESTEEHVTQEVIQETIPEEPLEKVPVEEDKAPEDFGTAAAKEVEEEQPRLFEPKDSEHKVLEMMGFVASTDVIDDHTLGEPLEPEKVVTTVVELLPVVEEEEVEEIVEKQVVEVPEVEEPIKLPETSAVQSSEDRRPSEVSIVVIEPEYLDEAESVVEVATVDQSLEEPRPNLATEDLLQREVSTDKSVDISEHPEAAETIETAQEESLEISEQVTVDDKREKTEESNISNVEETEQPTENIPELTTNPESVAETSEDQKLEDKPAESAIVTEERFSRTSIAKSPAPEGDYTKSKRASTMPERTVLCDLALSYQCRWANGHEGSNQRFECPAEITCCHRVGQDQLIVHWDVGVKYLEQIGEFQIYVDGQKHPGFYSNKRRKALIDEITTVGQHLISIYPTPKAQVSGGHQWAPGFFVYHQ